MKRGICFEIPNKHGSLLGEMLKPIDITVFSWRIGNGESYRVVDNKLVEDLFSEDQKVMEGVELKNLLENNLYYIIFADIQAYPKGELSDIKTYEEFLESQCELVVLVIDCCEVMIYCKNKDTIESLYLNAIECGFKDIRYMTDENDTNTRLYAW